MKPTHPILLFLLAAASCAAAQPERREERLPLAAVTLTARPTVRLQHRVSRDVPFRRDLSGVRAFSFGLRVTSATDLPSFTCYIRSGDGWYSQGFDLPEGADIRPVRIRVPLGRGLKREGRPAGWDRVSAVRLAANRGTTNAAEAVFSDFALEFGPPDPPPDPAVERAREAAELELVRALSGKAGERRLVWCHSAWGLGGTNDWNSTCRFVREQGFTDLIANLAWAGCAFYPSKVLPRVRKGPQDDALALCRAACRAQGLKLHVWFVCWNLGDHADADLVAAAAAEGRVQTAADGTAAGRWFCPSHPVNRDLEIRAMTELALEKDVDGIHFDYIRYPNAGSCFCAGCRARFERSLGRKVGAWPADVLGDGVLVPEWYDFRMANIDAVVGEVSRRVRAAGSRVEISAAVFPDFRRTPDTLGQDWLAWCRRGWLDFVCPMDYSDRPANFARTIASQRDALRGLKTKLYPGLAIACSHYRPLSALTAAWEIEAVRAAGLSGFTLFHLGRHAEKLLPVLRGGPLSAVERPRER